MAEFECRLKKYRQLKELTQEQLAEKVGVRRETIMRLEKAQQSQKTQLWVDFAGGVCLGNLFLIFYNAGQKQDGQGEYISAGKGNRKNHRQVL